METARSKQVPVLVALMAGMVTGPFVSGYLRRHDVATSPLRALIVGVVGGLITLTVLIATRGRLSRSTSVRMPIWLGLLACAIVMGLASLFSDWIG